MKCYFCQQELESLHHCFQHVYTITHLYHYNLLKDQYELIVVNFITEHFEFQVRSHDLGEPLDQLLVLDRNIRQRIYLGSIPKNFSPENAVDFATRISRLLVFL